MIKAMFISAILVAVQTSAAAEREYARTDGALDLICADANYGARPHNSFILRGYYDKAGGVSAVDASSDDEIPFGALAYQITAVQHAFFGSEEFSLEQSVAGCEMAPLAVNASQGGAVLDLKFECDSSGEAGRGNLTLDVTAEQMTGQITFPKGQGDLRYPISAGSTFDLTCDFFFEDEN